ncbi:MAG TPA: CxxxxCH/CxxCH domain-containing protein [bacterium]|jgi:predicted CxxxxCH...CXXCH cytochrome family protein
MKQHKSLWIFLGLLALALMVAMVSCKTTREQSTLGPHPAGWNDPASAAFHGFAAARDSNSCRECHGQDLHGGSSGRSCYDCHATFPHPATWMDTTSSAFHGVAAKTDSSKSCVGCHGSDFQGGISGVGCYRCHTTYPHIVNTAWQQPLSTSPLFHGWYAQSDTNGPGQTCKPCHGTDFRGTPRANSCYDCHSVLHTTVENEDTDTHRAFVASKGWKINDNCAVCHGTDFTGGAAAGVDSAAVCIQCHAPTDNVMMLTGCNVCHTTEPELRSFWKVPFGTADAGAHPLHVADNKFSCRECHPSLSASGHPHPLPADVAFNRAVLADTFGFSPAFSHVGAPNSGNGACSNVYCHSNGLNPNFPPHQNPRPAVVFPQWTLHGGCGMCHAIPPSLADDPSHPQGTGLNCSACHHDVDPNSNFNFPDSIRFVSDSLHVDANYHL